MHTPTVKAVIFDVGNVLVEVNVTNAIARLAPQVDDHLTQKVLGIGDWGVYDAFERGHLSEAQFLHALRDYLAVELPDPELAAWWNSSLEKLVDGVEGVLHELFGRVPVYGLSNTNPTHFDYFTRHIPIFQHFEGVVASFHVGSRKPEVELFEAAARLIGYAPAELLFIDDLPSNVEGARAVGYQAEHCLRSSQGLRDILGHYGLLRR